LRNRDSAADAGSRGLAHQLGAALGTPRYAVTDDPRRRAIGGGNCAFTAAWLRPDRFQRVFCSVSSLVQMPGGNPYPELILAQPRKPLRIFIHAAHRDLR
jgi:hypothetical protein